MRIVVEVDSEDQAATIEKIARERGWKTTRPKRTGRKRVQSRPDFSTRWAKIAPDLLHGRISLRKAAERLGIGATTVARLRDVEKKQPDVRR